MDNLPNTTRRCAFAAAFLLLVVGCTSEESGSGCSIKTIGFSNSSESELGVGRFEFKAKSAEAAYTKPVPLAIGKGSSFELSFKPYDEKNTSAASYALRSANGEMLEQAALDNTTFKAKKAGIVAVLATSSSNPNQVFDLVHLRVIAPTKFRLSSFLLSESEDAALQRGNAEMPAGASTTITITVMGEVDEENGPIPDSMFTKGKAVGETLELEGMPIEVVSSNEKVVAVETKRPGEVTAKAGTPGEADVKLTAGDLSKTVHVVVTKGGWQ